MADDQKPDVVADKDELFSMSTGASGTNHPAILSLLPVEKPAETTGVAHEDVRDLWILEVNAAAEGDKQVPLRLVVIGHAEA